MKPERIPKTTWTREEVERLADGTILHLRNGWSGTLEGHQLTERHGVIAAIYGGSLAFSFSKKGFTGIEAWDIIAYSKPPIEYVTREGGHRVTEIIHTPPTNDEHCHTVVVSLERGLADYAWLLSDFRLSETHEHPFIIPKSEYEALHAWEPGKPGTPEQKRAWAEKHKGEKWSRTPAKIYFIVGSYEGDFFHGPSYAVDDNVATSSEDVWSMEDSDWQLHSGNFDDYRESSPYEQLIAREYPVSGGVA